VLIHQNGLGPPRDGIRQLTWEWSQGQKGCPLASLQSKCSDPFCCFIQRQNNMWWDSIKMFLDAIPNSDRGEFSQSFTQILKVLIPHCNTGVRYHLFFHRGKNCSIGFGKSQLHVGDFSVRTFYLLKHFWVSTTGLQWLQIFLKIYFPCIEDR
jgi:hypothetical protein